MFGFVQITCAGLSSVLLITSDDRERVRFHLLGFEGFGLPTGLIGGLQELNKCVEQRFTIRSHIRLLSNTSKSYLDS